MAGHFKIDWLLPDRARREQVIKAAGEKFGAHLLRKDGSGGMHILAEGEEALEIVEFLKTEYAKTDPEAL